MIELKKVNYLFSIVIILTFLFIIAIGIIGTKYDPDFYDVCGKTIYKSSNFAFYSLDSSFSESDFHIINSDINNFSFSFVPRALSDGTLSTIGIYTSYMSYKIWSGDEVLYSYCGSHDGIVKSGATEFAMIRIPAKYIGQEVHVDFNLEVVKLNKNEFHILVGKQRDIWRHIYSEEYFDLLVSFFAFIIASMMVSLGILSLIFKLNSNRYLIVGIFIFFLSIYVFLQTKSVFVLINSPIMVYFLDYIVASSYVASLAYILYSSVRGKNCYIGKIIYELFLINIAVQSLLSITGVSEYIYFREFSFSLVIVLSSIMMYILFIKRDPDYPFKNESDKEKLIAFSSLIMFLGLFIGLIIYIIEISKTYFIPAYSSLLIYVMIHLFVSLDTYSKDYNKSKKLKHFIQAALYDNLTKVGSRYSFDTDVKELKGNPNNYKDIILGLLDVNDLKYVNDGYGHDVGDRVLVDMGCVLQCFEEEYLAYNSKVYRIGGDEFAIILFDAGEKIFNEVEDKLNYYYKEYLKDNPDSLLKFSYGFGYEKLNDDFDFGKLNKKVDLKMFDNKKRSKENDLY